MAPNRRPRVAGIRRQRRVSNSGLTALFRADRLTADFEARGTADALGVFLLYSRYDNRRLVWPPSPSNRPTPSFHSGNQGISAVETKAAQKAARAKHRHGFRLVG